MLLQFIAVGHSLQDNNKTDCLPHPNPTDNWSRWNFSTILSSLLEQTKVLIKTSETLRSFKWQTEGHWVYIPYCDVRYIKLSCTAWLFSGKVCNNRRGWPMHEMILLGKQRRVPGGSNKPAGSVAKVDHLVVTPSMNQYLSFGAMREKMHPEDQSNWHLSPCCYAFGS